jgi:hypothetical protein
MKQVNKMLEHVNKEMNASELAKVMEKFEQVSSSKSMKFYLLLLLFSLPRHSKILMLKSK